MDKPILCLDFDGVCSDYASGWQGAHIINDSPVPGLFEFLIEAQKEFKICVFSSRSGDPSGNKAMQRWFRRETNKWQGLDNAVPLDPEQYRVYFPLEKPPAFLSIDDRAITFDGTFPDVAELLKFKPWNKR